MKIIDVDSSIYHGLAGGIPFWQIKDVIDISMKQLDDIFKYGGIYSREHLLKLGIIYNYKQPIYNGYNYISVCLKKFPDCEFDGDNAELDSAYFRYSKNKISIVIDPRISNKYREDNYNKLPGERQIKDKIDINDFCAISVGINDPKRQLVVSNNIQNILDHYNINIPIVDSDGYLIIEKKQKLMMKKH